MAQLIMKEFKFTHKEETWLDLTIKAYDYNLAVINIEKCGININDFDYNLDARKLFNFVKKNEAEQLILSGVSQRSELLPEFLMHDLDGKIITSVIGSADVTKEWNEYLGNCG